MRPEEILKKRCNDSVLVGGFLKSYENTQFYILGCKIGCLFCNLLIFSIYCGERGIRTPGTSQFNGFQDRRNRPLCHLSNMLRNHFYLIAVQR